MCFNEHEYRNNLYWFKAPNALPSILAAALNVNHALGRPAYQSSNSGEAGMAVDGDFKTSTITNIDLHSYWVVDLQMDIWVSAIALTNGNTRSELLHNVSMNIIRNYTKMNLNLSKER